ncbi:SRPBCC family protein [Flagellimonas flava]|uniref:SRPBCC family protein n=1 Tax=Flagellimonas flava TaxID=570519 RepID=UPI003D6500D8
MPSSKSNINVHQTIIVDAGINEVWKALAEDFDKIGEWSSGVNHSEGFGEPVNGSMCGERACKINAPGFSNAKERITVYDKNSYMLSYDLYEGVPSFVKSAEITWMLMPIKEKTQMQVVSKMRATGLLGFLMRGFMRSSTKNALRSMCEELAYYIENNKPHPKKMKAIEKFNKKKK